jgi:hypothetical protein
MLIRETTRKYLTPAVAQTLLLTGCLTVSTRRSNLGAGEG